MASRPIRTRPEERVIPVDEGVVDGKVDVSIRTRPEERVIPSASDSPLNLSVFQSAPAPKSG